MYARAEQALLQVAYTHTGQNQLATARLLGLSRHVVRARLIQHHILAAAESEAEKNHPPLAQGKNISPITMPDLFPTEKDYKEPFFAESSQECWGF